MEGEKLRRLEDQKGHKAQRLGNWEAIRIRKEERGIRKDRSCEDAL